MSMVNSFETSVLNHLFQNASITNVGDATGLPAAATAGSTQLALSTAALVETDTLLTATEGTYTGYTRPTQPRSAVGWVVAGNTADNAALIQFGEMTAGGPKTEVHVGLGFLATGNVLCLEADLNADLIVNNGVNPQFAIGALDWTLD